MDRASIQVGNGEQKPSILIESTEPFNSFAGANSNNCGTVVYVAGNLLDVPVDFPVTSTISTVSNGQTTEIASTEGIFSFFNSEPALNNNGEDKFSLGSHLQFDRLGISQHDSNTEISLLSTGEVLASLYDIDAQAIDATDFVCV